MKILASDYKNLFKLQGRLTCLHGEFLVRGSMSLGDPIVLCRKNDFRFFLHRDSEKLCLRKGLAIFSDADKYKHFSNEFRSYILMAKKEIIPRFKNDTQILTKQEFQRLLPILAKLWYFYGITESSYHDLAYQKLLETKNPSLRKNLDDVSKLKFAGRELLNAYIFKNGVLPNLLQSIGRQFLENKTDALFLFSKELMGLFDHRQVSKNVIHARKKCYGCASHHGRFAIYPFSVAVGAWKKLCVPQKAVKEIKGIVAYAGKVFGHVVVVPMLVDTQEIAKISKSMKRGDVLVAESTTPELLVLCKKAAAIVTDQGGMLSHAAIVSRELGIPCIIGTGKATHIFKAGDVVEVDADRGTVRKMR